ncbi:four helix bundle protein [Candidatus Roizmanbacteria bacterium]|nr:four helix bundle protein [Candidatus Roizmanbacteria bacterium]
MSENYLSLEKLDTYKLARRLGSIVWGIFNLFDRETRRLFGYQFVEATDSIAANIAEGYGRFHYLDKVKFYYNARGSLLESRHWFDITIQRVKLGNKNLINNYLTCYKEVRLTLNGLINSAMRQKIKS